MGREAASAPARVARIAVRGWIAFAIAVTLAAPLPSNLADSTIAVAAAQVFTVNSTGDQNDSNPGDGVCRTSSGTCTLRAAIREANSNIGHDRIEFNIAGSGPHTIRPSSQYPLLVDPSGITIDGYTQPGSSVNTLGHGSNAVIKIQLEGPGPQSFDGLDIRTGNGIVRGLAIYDFRLHIRFWGSNASGNEIVGNFIGTNAAGTFGHSRRWLNSTGVQLERGASNNRIGMPGNANRNVISGNGDRGVGTFDDDTDGNLIQNNVIGLNPSGSARLANWGHGVDVNYNSSYNIIGGTGPGEGNVLSGNQLSGVEISHMVGSDDVRATQGNEVLNNLIGTNLTGTAAPSDFRNREHGVNLEGKGACPVWCSPDMRRNRVEGNVIVGSQAGVIIWKGAHENEVVDNVIGVLADGSPAASSALTTWGVLIETAAFDNVVEGNRISGVPNGVQVRPDNNYPATSNPPTFPTFGNTITKNSIYNVGPGLAIDLWPVGAINTGGNATPSDVQHGVDLPTITSPDTSSVTVATCPGCEVELFLADYDCPTSGYSCSSHGQGRQYVASRIANSSGLAEFVFRDDQSDPYVLIQGDQISATTTNPFGSTSEFSARVIVVEGSIPPPDPVDRHVVHVSIDGINSSMLAGLMTSDPGATDTFRRLADEGASTFNARTDYSHTNTLPNHVSMLTARPVTQPAGLPNTTHHGWTTNNDPLPGQTLHNAGNPNLSYIPSVFDVVHDHGLSTAAYVTKSKFSIFDVSYDGSNGAPDTTGPDDGRDKIDTYFSDGTTANMQATMLAGLAANDFDYTFVHYGDPDFVGHATDWGSPEYFESLRVVDDYLGELLATIEADPQLSGNTAVIVTSDHGGGDPVASHSNVTSPVNYTIPFFVWGPGVQPGADLYVLNGGRGDPGTGRPTYRSPAPPIRNGESGTLALDLLGLPPIAGSLLDDPLSIVARGSNQAPSVSNPGPQTSAVAESVSVPIVASDPDGDVVTFRRRGCRRVCRSTLGPG